MDFASRSNRCFSSGLEERWDARTLIATVQSKRVSRARYTSPMPPAPSGARISYGPSFVPEVRAIGALHYTVRPRQEVNPKRHGVAGQLTVEAALRCPSADGRVELATTTTNSPTTWQGSGLGKESDSEHSRRQACNQGARCQPLGKDAEFVEPA